MAETRDPTDMMTIGSGSSAMVSGPCRSPGRAGARQSYQAPDPGDAVPSAAPLVAFAPQRMFESVVRHTDSVVTVPIAQSRP